MLGETVDIDRKPYKIIGVMVPSFLFPLQGPQLNHDPADLFVPASWTKTERQDVGNMYNHSVIARLKPGVTPAQASADLSSLLREFAKHYPPDVLRSGPVELTGSVLSFREKVVGPIQTALLILLAAVGVVLLIGCADAANLMLARISPRQREFAVRAAVGADRTRLICQSLTESLALSVLGGIAGVVLAFWCTPALIRWAPVQISQLQNAGLDWRVVFFVSGICLLAQVLFGLAPALDAANQDIVTPFCSPRTAPRVLTLSLRSAPTSLNTCRAT